ncbi:MAG: HD domain-containing protein [Gemmatimonadales bacterium]|nr:HD domain-containing protein [Gemmatimonadales bacterium]
MYSDRIHHAFAFAAKHYPEPISRYDGQSCLIKASSVAVILARHGVDESTIVASILKQLVDACPYPRQESLAREILAKFGPTVAFAVEAAAEPRFDVLGRERTWKAARFEYLTRLAAAAPSAVDVCVADELHRIGAALVSIRRLGVEYTEVGGVPSEDSHWWLATMGEMLAGHPTWTRQEMLSEFRRLAAELAQRLRDGGA